MQGVNQIEIWLFQFNPFNSLIFISNEQYLINVEIHFDVLQLFTAKELLNEFMTDAAILNDIEATLKIMCLWVTTMNVLCCDLS